MEAGPMERKWRESKGPRTVGPAGACPVRPTSDDCAANVTASTLASPRKRYGLMVRTPPKTDTAGAVYTAAARRAFTEPGARAPRESSERYCDPVFLSVRVTLPS